MEAGYAGLSIKTAGYRAKQVKFSNVYIRTEANMGLFSNGLFGRGMMKLFVLALTAWAITGCTNMGVDDSRQWTHIACSGASDWTACWRQAEEICPTGFDVANKEEDRSALKREVDIACK